MSEIAAAAECRTPDDRRLQSKDFREEESCVLVELCTIYGLRKEVSGLSF
jgi:hypothetical protein